MTSVFRAKSASAICHHSGDNGDSFGTKPEQIQRNCHHCHQTKTRSWLVSHGLHKWLQRLTETVTRCPCARGVEIAHLFSLFSTLFIRMPRARARASGDRTYYGHPDRPARGFSARLSISYQHQILDARPAMGGGSINDAPSSARDQCQASRNENFVTDDLKPAPTFARAFFSGADMKGDDHVYDVRRES
jgi:hypothetical protein